MYVFSANRVEIDNSNKSTKARNPGNERKTEIEVKLIWRSMEYSKTPVWAKTANIFI